MPYRVSAGQGEVPEGEIISWANKLMSQKFRVLKEHAPEIIEAGVNAAQDEIAALGRVADPHDPRDTPKDPDLNMYKGVHGEFKDTGPNDCSIAVGWDLRDYRHGYPELQEKGYAGVSAMNALQYARIAMETKIARLMRNRST